MCEETTGVDTAEIRGALTLLKGDSIGKNLLENDCFKIIERDIRSRCIVSNYLKDW